MESVPVLEVTDSKPANLRSTFVKCQTVRSARLKEFCCNGIKFERCNQRRCNGLKLSFNLVMHVNIISKIINQPKIN